MGEKLNYLTVFNLMEQKKTNKQLQEMVSEFVLFSWK